MSFLSTIRHDEVFNRNQFNLPVHIVGVGATGSKIALSLGKLGIGDNLHLWDDDVVEPHNVANQAYGLHHVGTPKVEACSDLLKMFTGSTPHIHNEKVTRSTRLDGVVFLLVDTMDTRKEIWDGALKMKLPVKCVIETRMGVNEGRVYVFDPKNFDQIRDWESTLYSSAEAVTSACGSKISIGPTADAVNAFAVWQFIRWFNSQTNGAEAPEFETMFGLNPVGVFTSAMA